MNALQDTTKGKYKKMYQETTHKNLQNLNRVLPSLHSGTCLKMPNIYISAKLQEKIGQMDNFQLDKGS